MESGLVAVALVIRSKDGPQFVFHYPPRPAIKAKDRNALYGTDLHNGEINAVNSNSEDSDWSDIEENQHIPLNERLSKINLKAAGVKRPKNKMHRPIEELEGDGHEETSKGEHIVPWEHLLEFSTDDLESILTPARAFHKQMFDLSLDPLHYVSCPYHIREDGTWKRKSAKKSKKDAKGKGKDDSEDDGGMTMFNVVCIVDVGKQGAQARINNIYEHVAKKFNKALNHAQATSNYVWKESEMILQMKEKAKEERRPMSWLWNEIMIRSTLAAAMRDIYIAVVNNKIATVSIGNKSPIDMSLQISIPAFLTRLPGFKEEARLGMLVTSANPYINEEGEEDPTYLNKHFALLLMDDEATIIADIQADDNELSAALIQCISLCKPIFSFHQVAQKYNIELNGLLVLAQHLIHWRRAIAVPPLNTRETYIVNPNSDNRKLPATCVAWKKAFPYAPTLPHFLANISATPRPLKDFAPSKDHRQMYVDMIAWLYRGGWVTVLRMFAWINVWPEIIYEVQYQLKADALEKTKKTGSDDTAGKSGNKSSSTESTDESGNDKKVSSDPNTVLTPEQTAEIARVGRLKEKVAQDAADDAATFAEMPIPVATEDPSINDAEHLRGITPHIIKDPHRATNEESLYIKAIGARFTNAKHKEFWPRFVKYFNGLEALEGVALKENMKRRETMDIIIAFQEHLIVCKHW